MSTIIYKAINQLTEEAYIGFTNNLKRRQREHYSSAERGSTYHFHRVIRKYGMKIFEWKIIGSCSTREEAGDFEVQMIAEHDTYHNGYNSTTGGDFRFTMSKESCLKKALSLKGRKHSAEHIRKNSEAHKGQIPWIKGKKLGVRSEEHRLNISKSRKGQPAWNKGIPHTKEAIQNISNSLLGKYKGRKQEQVCCPYCEKIGGISLMKRWHFDNCKYHDFN